MSCDQSKKPTLANFFERIREGTTRDSTTEADARSQRLHHRAIEAVGDGADAHVLRVRGLHLILLEWLHLDHMLSRVARVVIAVNVLGN